MCVCVCVCVCMYVTRGRERERERENQETVHIECNEYWFSENPHSVNKIPFLYFILGAECKMGELKIIEPIIFEKKILSLSLVTPDIIFHKFHG